MATILWFSHSWQVMVNWVGYNNLLLKHYMNQLKRKEGDHVLALLGQWTSHWLGLKYEWMTDWMVSVPLPLLSESLTLYHYQRSHNIFLWSFFIVRPTYLVYHHYTPFTLIESPLLLIEGNTNLPSRLMFSPYKTKGSGLDIISLGFTYQ